MNKKWKVVNRQTGETWKPLSPNPKQWLMLYDSGYPAVVTDGGGYGSGYWITSLDPKIWKVVYKTS